MHRSATSRETGDRAGDRRRQHDATAARRDQRVEAGLHAVDGPLHIDVQHVGQLVGGHGLQRGVGEDAGVGAQHIQPAECPDDLLSHRGAGIAVGNVDRDAHDLA
jgi:hypothetical protein